MEWEVVRKRLLTIVIVVSGIIVLLLPTELGPYIDKYNPFYKTKSYYTLVNDVGYHVGDGWYEYEFVAYDEEGREKKITKTIKQMLKRNEPLKIVAKGRYGEALVSIEKEDIPIKARGFLRER
ncbi:ferrichrome ABC transporter permease [Bacillus manliponensis]|uniref:Ferrichrome ABC transporter permease n=1 Tax=Bacillus manliponensis TaxID=574376 RepID=A0A073JUR4_9BACI|nr:YxeA family protein [Bacillus manliponensis]KEK18040.1 ferrichrome ABC transporter permease [Bacillus manliponensis]